MTCAHYALKNFGVYRLNPLVEPAMRKLYVTDAPGYRFIQKFGEIVLAEYTLSVVQCDNVCRDVSEQEGENPDEQQK